MRENSNRSMVIEEGFQAKVGVKVLNWGSQRELMESMDRL